MSVPRKGRTINHLGRGVPGQLLLSWVFFLRRRLVGFFFLRRRLAGFFFWEDAWLDFFFWGNSWPDLFFLHIFKEINHLWQVSVNTYKN